MLDSIHSVYVDQWDWEKVITPEERNFATLRQTVESIWTVFHYTQEKLCRVFPQLSRYLPEHVHFITSQELEDRWPDLTPKEREHAVCKEYGAVFLSQIGGDLKSGLLLAVIFPAALLACALAGRKGGARNGPF